MIDDPNIKLPPTVHDMAAGDNVLEFDYAFFWKYSSAHVHAGHESGEVTVEVQRWTLEQLYGGVVRHAAGTYRKIATHFQIDLEEAEPHLADAEHYSAYNH